MKLNRGHESDRHLAAKLESHYLFDDRQWAKFYEERYADMILYHYATSFTAAIEFETTPRNVSRNLRRNLANGCHAVAVVSLDPLFHKQIKNKAFKYATSAHRERFSVFSFDFIGHQNLLAWLTHRAHTHHIYAGGER